MVKLNDWETILHALKNKNPVIYGKIVDWYPSGRNEIIIKTEDEETMIYNFINDRFRKIRTDSESLTEDEWRIIFAERLNSAMISAGIPRWELSRLTGISEVSISRYMNAKATPSTYNIDRIARVLNCSSSELIDV